MKKEKLIQESINTIAEVATPHFDDEQTLLSARPVVPLEKIKHRRHWFLGGAFALAMMLGATSALVASYLRLRNVYPAPEATQVEIAPAPVITQETPNGELPTIASLEESESDEETEPVIVEDPDVPATAKKGPSGSKTVARPEPDFIPSRESSGMSEEEELERIRDAVLLDEWQERRARRANRRERRRAERENRDLSNLDEIFEGRRRPLNP